MDFTRPTTKDELLADLSAVDEYYRPQLDDITMPTFTNVSLTRMSYTAETDLQLETQATAYAQREVDVLLAEYTNPYTTKMAANRLTLQESENNRTLKIADLDLQKAEELAGVDTELAKNGIALSTVSSGLKQKIAEKYARLKIKLNAEYDAIKSNLNTEYGSLSGIVTDATALFADKQTKIYNDELNRLKEERRKKQDEVLKYNNQLAERENVINNGLLERKARLEMAVSQAISNGYSMEKLEALGLYDDKIAVIHSYYSTFSATDAYLDFSQTNAFVKHLGKYYYQVLYDMYRLAKLDE